MPRELLQSTVGYSLQQLPICCASMYGQGNPSRNNPVIREGRNTDRLMVSHGYKYVGLRSRSAEATCSRVVYCIVQEQYSSECAA